MDGTVGMRGHRNVGMLEYRDRGNRSVPSHPSSPSSLPDPARAAAGSWTRSFGSIDADDRRPWDGNAPRLLQRRHQGHLIVPQAVNSRLRHRSDNGDTLRLVLLHAHIDRQPGRHIPWMVLRDNRRFDLRQRHAPRAQAAR